MKRLLVAGVATILMVTASHAMEGGYASSAASVYGYPRAGVAYGYPNFAGWSDGRYHAVRHHKCVIPDVCASGYYAYGHWTGPPKTECVCR